MGRTEDFAAKNRISVWDQVHAELEICQERVGSAIDDLDEAREDLVIAMQRARRRGWSFREIAGSVGMSHQRVAQLLAHPLVNTDDVILGEEHDEEA